MLQQMKSKFPKAWAALETWIQKQDIAEGDVTIEAHDEFIAIHFVDNQKEFNREESMHLRDLLDFFDSKQIYIGFTPNSKQIGPVIFEWEVYHSEAFKGFGSALGRQNMEYEAFAEAFKILNKLCQL